MPRKKIISDNAEAIFIESSDEITSLVEKIRLAKSSDIRLIVSERVSLLQSSINLKILKKVSNEASKTILLVSPDPIIQNLATKVGFAVEGVSSKDIKLLETHAEQTIDKNHPEDNLPPAINWWGKPILTEKEQEFVKETFSLDPVEGEQTHTERPTAFESEGSEEADKVMVESLDEALHRPKVSKQTNKITASLAPILSSFDTFQKKVKELIVSFSSRSFMPVFLGIIVLLLFFCFVVVLPKATITVYTQGETFEQQFTIQATDLVIEPNFTLRQIPSKYFEVSAEGEATIETTGEKYIGEYAKGVIDLKNKTGLDRTLPLGTVIQAKSAGKQFKLLQTVVVPKATVDSIGRIVFGSRNGIEVQATEVGEESNIKQDDFIVGSLPFVQVWGESFKNFSGGSSEKIRVASQTDIEKLQSQVAGQAKSKAHTELLKFQDNGYIIPLESITSKDEVVKYSSEPGQKAEELSLYMKVISAGIAYREEDVQKVLLRSFQEMIPANYSIMDDSITHSVSLDSVDVALRALYFKATATTKLLPSYDEGTLLSKLRFASFGEAKEIIKETIKTEYLSEPSITMWPFSIGKLPLLTRNISINFSTEPPK